MIKAFDNWFEAHAQWLKDHGVWGSFSQTLGLDKNSAHGNFRTNAGEVDVQVWETGECDVISCNYEDPEPMIKHYEFKTAEALVEQLDYLIKFVAQLSTVPALA